MKKRKLLAAATILSLTLIFTLALTACDLDNNAGNSKNNDGSITGVDSTNTGNNSDSPNLDTDAKENKDIDTNTGSKAGTDTNADENLRVGDFFPFQKDIHMKFKGIGNEYAEYETYVEFIDGNVMQIRNLNPGTNLAMVYEIKDGELRLNFSKGEVYYRYDFTDTKDADRVEVLIKEPIKKGATWTLKDGTKRSITEVSKEISTPAGNYTALEITSEYENSFVTDYYVKDLGHVKRVFKSKDDDYTVTSELEKIEKDVPFKETIRFFYPDFMNGRLAYIDREIELFTNHDIKNFFEKELKNVPEGSQLKKALSENTRLLNIIIDEPLGGIIGSVVVDFSKELVNEMNAGTSLEGMIITSITNTFGGYYQTSKVKITLDGKPYESGHFLLKPDEFFTVDTENSYEYK